jgi:chemotaxis-related protein WspB
MVDQAQQPDGVLRAQREAAMLLLIFRVAGDAYAVEAAHVVEVVPRVDLRALPNAPEGLAGLFRYRGRVVPVIDLGVLLGDGPCPPRLSTRIILVDDHKPARAEPRVGLIAEHVSDVKRVGDDQVAFPPAVLGQASFLGPIVSAETGLIPLIDVDRVLSGPLRRALVETEAGP